MIVVDPYQRDGAWYFKLQKPNVNVELGPYDTEDDAWERLEAYLRALECPNGSCEA